MAKKEFPEIKKKNEGKFTAWVEKNMGGMDTCKAASKVMRSRTKKYSSAVVKMANYANNFGCKTKKEDGASVPLKGKQNNLPDALKSKILASDGASMKKTKDNKRKKVTVEKDGNYSAKTVEYKKGKKAGATKTKSKSTGYGRTRKSTEVSRKGYGVKTTTTTKDPGATFFTKGKYGEKPTSTRVVGKKATKVAKKSQKKILKNK